MSSRALRVMASRMLNQLDRSDMRQRVEGVKGQLFVFDEDTFKNTVTGYFLDEGFIEEEALKQASYLTDEFNRRLLNAEKNIPRAWKKRLDIARQEVIEKGRGHNKIYEVTSYRTVQTIKTHIGKLFEEIVGRPESRFRITGKITKEKSSVKSEGFHIGHGELGTPVQATKATAAKSNLQNNRSLYRYTAYKELKQAILQYEEDLILELNVGGEQLVTATGLFHKKYTPILTAQFASSNAIDAIDEKSAFSVLRKEVERIRNDLLHQEGSATLYAAIESVLLYNVTKEIKKGKLKSKNKPKSSVKSKSDSGPVRSKKKVKSKVPIITGSGAPRKPTKKKKKEKQVNRLSLLAILNQKLPRTIQKYMVFPALVYRTGRFADSVKALRIQKNIKGPPTIVYKYQMDPYQVFEPTLGRFPWNTPERDPKKLIDKSIREIAEKYMAERFFTRRL